ncbi:hypothetical protein TNCV_3055871 [Trichonephila clavipes]|nr:hypothetical protein TNCV_3055871 [Trichonephila clavipes]
MDHDENLERCKLILTGMAGCGSPVVKVSKHGRHVMSSIPVPLKTRRVGQRCTLNLSRAETSSRWCDLNCLQENRLKVNSEREQDSPVEMGASNISRFKEMPFLKAKRHRAHSVVSGVRVKGKQAKKKNDPTLRDYKRSTSSLESLIGH